MQTLVMRNSADDFDAMVEEEIEAGRAKSRGRAILLARKRNGKSYNAWRKKREREGMEPQKQGGSFMRQNFRFIGA
jgi:hypothetical protein